MYLVFQKLQQRDIGQHQPVNKANIEKLFLVRASVLEDLSERPSLPALAKMCGLSETRMTDLFRQVFGNSIYNYYQIARMNEAAFLWSVNTHLN
jgi:AraC-like DNA-binding protein